MAGVRIEPGQISYDLPVRNYRHLRKVDAVRPERLLVLFLMPEDEVDWFAQDRQGLSLHHACYYLSLRGLPETENQRTVPVMIPDTNLFSVSFLHGLLLNGTTS